MKNEEAPDQRIFPDSADRALSVFFVGDGSEQAVLSSLDFRGTLFSPSSRVAS
jgi:hypothetical protein